VRHQRSPFTTVASGMIQRSTYAVRADRSGRLWATTENGLVLRLEGERWTTVLAANAMWESPNIWPSGTGGMLIVNALGRAWMGGASGVRDVSTEIGLQGLHTIAVLEDNDGSVWASTDSGLYHAVRGVATRVAIPGLASPRAPRLIHRDSRGRLLLGDPGLTIVDGATVTRTGATEGLTDNVVRALYDDRENLWVGTADSGLFVVRNSKTVHLAPFNERLRRDVLGIIADNEGYLWLTSRTGLFRVARRALEAAADGGTVDEREGRDVEFAEATAEGDQVGIGQRLPANEEGRMLVPGALDDGKVGITDAREINTGHFGAHRRADLAH
jgi:ligand-binding sensor domain-containing protein